ncbi:MAG: tryptophan 7-halogenase [Gammaproteobacteria bacterium]|nr:tryptophan 7-halogenase [Gammaproteobacteria bacterium]
MINIPNKVIILGGGTAGWMAANLLMNRWSDHGIKIEVIESPQIGIIGVGEGSTPQLKSFFDTLGISEEEWMPKCNATFKHGIRFNDWSAHLGFESYFHSFPAKTDRDTARAFVYNTFLRRQGLNVQSLPDYYFLPAYLAEQVLGPHATENFPFPSSYGYHFDSYLLGDFLKQKAIECGVDYTQDEIQDALLNEYGDISDLQGANGHRYVADFYIDATGFDSVLLQQKTGVGFDNFSSNLFNDRAVVLPSRHPNLNELKPQTVATAMKFGWRWAIPLTNRIGNGYVFSSAYCSEDQAEQELRRALGLLESDIQARHLKMRVGQVRQHWSNNCLGVGLSQGFIEPLEATALHLVQTTLEQFIEAIEARQSIEVVRDEFNRRIVSRFEGIRDYIVCHYKVNSRVDTDYWRSAREDITISGSLESILQVWDSNGDLSEEIDRQRIGAYYSSLSWHSLLAGYGRFRTFDSLNSNDERIARFPLESVIDFNRRCAMNFSNHTDQLWRPS